MIAMWIVWECQGSWVASTHKQPFAADSAEEQAPPSKRIAPGATYNDFPGAGGEFHVHLAG